MARTQQERLEAIRHVVHEYANLVSSGDMVLSGKHLGRDLEFPVNIHVEHAFLLNCRKMADFFCRPTRSDDITVFCFLENPDFELPRWEEWKRAIDKQLAHITYARQKPKSWTGAANGPLLEELREAWKQFRSQLQDPYKARFDEEISKLSIPGLNLE